MTIAHPKNEAAIDYHQQGHIRTEIQNKEAQNPIFADNFKSLSELGFAIIPCKGDDGKKPLVANFNKWKNPPSEFQLSQWAKKYPAANIGALTGLSGIIVVDVDNLHDLDIAIDLFGDTPLKSRTSRGSHLIYRSVPKVKSKNLRPYNLEIDIKAGTSHVLLPPSQHSSGAIYSWDNCDCIKLGELPLFKANRLHELTAGIETLSPANDNKPQRSKMQGPVAEGERGITLNDRLCKQASFCNTFDDLLDIARSINDEFLQPLEDGEVVNRASVVWNDFKDGKIEQWVGRTSKVRVTAQEIREFCAAGGKGDAWMLWLFLRTQHPTKIHNGEPFSFAPDSMEEAQCLPGWSASKYRYQFDLLLGFNKVEQVRGRTSSKGKFLPCMYTFKVK